MVLSLDAMNKKTAGVLSFFAPYSVVISSAGKLARYRATSKVMRQSASARWALKAI